MLFLFKLLSICLLLLASNFVHAQTDTTDQAATLSELSLEELLNVKVVTASGSPQTIGEAPSTMMVITAKQIAERGYEQLEDVLRDIPGVDLIHTYGQAPTFITFRGMYGDENKRMLLMIDGIVENSLMGGYEMAGASYSLHNAERIEIIWGPASALYGANAFSAVINIITKKGTDLHGVQYQAGYGSFNTWVHSLAMGTKKELNTGQLDISLSGSLFKTDAPRFTNRHPDYTNSYIDDAWSVNANIIYTVNKIKTTLGARAYQTPQGFGSITTSPTMLLRLPPGGNENKGIGGVMPMNFNGERPSLAETYARTAFLQSDITLSNKFTLMARVQYRETGLSNSSYAYANFPGTSFFSRDILAYSANRIKGDLAANYMFKEDQTISFGIQFSQDNLERGNRGVIPDTRMDTIENIPVRNIHAAFKLREYTIQNNVGAYVQDVISTDLLGNTAFTIGARFDHNSIYGNTFNPRVGIVNKPNDNVTIKLLYGSAFRAPTNFELYTIAGNRIANPNLKPEKINTFEANLIYTPTKILLLQGNYFFNYLTAVIIQGVPIGGNTVQNRNAGSASIQGLETKLDFIPSKSFSSFLNFTYQSGNQNDGTKKSDIPNIARVKGNVGMEMRFNKIITVSVIENWVGNRSVPATNPLGKVKGYSSTNLVISTSTLFHNRVRASLNIRNLFNQTYYDPGIRAADGNFFPTVVDQPGINGLFKISVSLF